MNRFPLPRAAICRSWCGDKAGGETPAFQQQHSHITGRSIFIRRERAQARGCIRVRRIITRFALRDALWSDEPLRFPAFVSTLLAALHAGLYTAHLVTCGKSLHVGRGRGGPDEKYKRSLRLSLLKSRAVKHGDGSVTRQASARRTVLVHRGCHRGCHRPSAGCSYTSLRRTRCSPKPM